MKNIRFICAQPASAYYSWQVEVMLNNFISMGINLNNVDIVCWKVNGVIPENWSRLASGYSARFLFYDDTRKTRHYISSIRPNILKQHCYIVFTKPIDWDQFLQDDKWYGSDCRWYISHDYIISKGEDVLDEMCRIVDIDKQIIKDNELNGIGAQYLMKGINADYWENVEKDCERLFKEITDLNNLKKQENPTYHELQIWCSDMWAVLWNGWKMGKQTVCHPALEFAWATSTEADWNRLNIFHNAGVTDATSGLFYKALYIDMLPYSETLDIKEGTASKKYWEIIQETAKKTVLL